MSTTRYTREQLETSHTAKVAELEAKLRKDIADNEKTLELVRLLPDLPYYGLIGTHGYHNTMRIGLRLETRDDVAGAMEALPPVRMMKWKKGNTTSFLPYDMIGEDKIQDCEQDISSCASFYFDRWFESQVRWFTFVEGIGFCMVYAEIERDPAHTQNVTDRGRVTRVNIANIPNGNPINYSSTPGDTPHRLVWFYEGNGSVGDQWNAVKDTAQTC